ADTIQLSATSTNLNSATDAQIVNVENISAAGASTGVTIDLHNQSEGFTIIGSSFADILTGGAGSDTFMGFAGSDVVNGGPGTDTIQLAGTSADLNAASDAQIINVEAVSAANAGAGVTIDLHNQSEGFILTGSSFADILAGGAGADTINGGS